MTILTAAELETIRLFDAGTELAPNETRTANAHRRALLGHIDSLERYYREFIIQRERDAEARISSLSPSAPGVYVSPKERAALRLAAHGTDLNHTDRMALRDLASRLAAPAGDGWRTWKAGDPIPPPGRYRCTLQSKHGALFDEKDLTIHPSMTAWNLSMWRVIAYDPRPLLEPYAPPSGAKGENE